MAVDRVGGRVLTISHSIDRVRRRMHTVAEGLVTFEEVNTHLDIEEVERGLELPELFDARGATTNITAEQVRRLVARAHATAQTRPLGPTAIVTDNDHFFGMARMYAILCEHLAAPVEVFRDVTDAVDWLDRWTEHDRR
jgi:hypothetical protein